MSYGITEEEWKEVKRLRAKIDECKKRNDGVYTDEARLLVNELAAYAKKIDLIKGVSK